LFIFGQLTFSSVAQAEGNATDKGWFSTFTDNVAQTWTDLNIMISMFRQ
jgi:palmitoyl transferase